jgi:hypothetical protein
LVLLAAGDERVGDREVLAGSFAADEEEILAAQSDAAQGTLGPVVVGRELGVVEEAAQGATMVQEIVHVLAYLRFRPVMLPRAPGPEEQLREERTRLQLPAPEVRWRARANRIRGRQEEEPTSTVDHR